MKGGKVDAAGMAALGIPVSERERAVVPRPAVSRDQYDRLREAAAKVSADVLALVKRLEFFEPHSKILRDAESNRNALRVLIGGPL